MINALDYIWSIKMSAKRRRAGTRSASMPSKDAAWYLPCQPISEQGSGSESGYLQSFAETPLIINTFAIGRSRNVHTFGALAQLLATLRSCCPIAENSGRFLSQGEMEDRQSVDCKERILRYGKRKTRVCSARKPRTIPL